LKQLRNKQSVSTTKQEHNNKKPLQISQSGKRKASQAPASKAKCQKPSGGSAAAAEV
jgi:hypothetical protein